MTDEMFERPKVVRSKATKRSGWRSGAEASRRSKTPFAPWRYLPTQCEMCLEVYPTAEHRFFCPKCGFCWGCCACREGRRSFSEIIPELARESEELEKKGTVRDMGSMVEVV